MSVIDGYVNNLETLADMVLYCCRKRIEVEPHCVSDNGRFICYRPLQAFVVSILLCISASATLVKIRVTDPAEASGVSKVLIIARPLDC